jgi:hypothetical protein
MHTKFVLFLFLFLSMSSATSEKRRFSLLPFMHYFLKVHEMKLMYEVMCPRIQGEFGLVERSRVDPSPVK